MGADLVGINLAAEASPRHIWLLVVSGCVNQRRNRWNHHRLGVLVTLTSSYFLPYGNQQLPGLQAEAMFDIPSPYPLRDASEEDLMGLAKAMWDWRLCDPCRLKPGSLQCSSQPCPGLRWTRMKPFFDYYKDVTSAYVPDMVAETPPALSGHNELFAIIQLLKDNPDTKRSELTSTHFANRDGKAPTPDDQDRAFNLAFRVMTTVTCCLDSRSVDTLEAGLQPIPWRDDMTWTEFLSTVFPVIGLDPGDGRDATSRRINELVTGRRLMKVGRLRFVPTDELRNHLKLNQRDGTVELYHHTSFLKESLIASRETQE